MEALLRNDFTAHYGLEVSTTLNIVLHTDAPYFEIEDDEHKESQLHFIAGRGVAAYKNTNGFEVNIINYDKFFTGLSRIFRSGKETCDLIVYTNSNLRYFLLNELKDRKPKPKVATKAISQLVTSLTMLMVVPSVKTFIGNYEVRRCCFFNKQSKSPANINATSAFGRFNLISANGLHMRNPDIEAFGFELWQYSGGQVFVLS